MSLDAKASKENDKIRFHVNSRPLLQAKRSGLESRSQTKNAADFTQLSIELRHSQSVHWPIHGTRHVRVETFHTMDYNYGNKMHGFHRHHAMEAQTCH